MLWYSESMRYLLTTISLLLVVLIMGCTMNFKAKELELETTPPLSYQLNGIQLAGVEVYHGPD